MTDEEKKLAEEAAANEADATAKVLQDKDATIAKLTEERENYRRGMLAAKGKITAGEALPADELDKYIGQKVQEELLNSQIFTAQAEKDAELLRITRENKEMKVALASRAQLSTPASAGGNNADNIAHPAPKFTPEQLAYIEKMSKQIGVKIDPEKILEMKAKRQGEI